MNEPICTALLGATHGVTFVALVHRLISRRHTVGFSSQPGGPMALLPIFCVARSSRTDLSMLVARALKIGKIADGGMPPTYETMH